MPDPYADNPDFWRSRAVESRAQAEQMPDPLLRQRMHLIAKSYEGMALRAEERLRQRREMIADAVPIGKQILLVEDDEVFRYATAPMLRSAGYAVQVAPDYRLALEILEGDERIDLPYRCGLARPSERSGAQPDGAYATPRTPGHLH